ncbi:MAG: hypothetical protein HYZ34_05920 [Ignavibacteriae bacterium]|nr:hypothetical protein [Ignavibacteriota bacterium]
MKELAPYGGAFLIFLGVVKLTIYYSAFNLQITSFLDLTEILSAFLNDLLFMTIAFSFLIVFDLATSSKSELESNKNLHETFSLEPKFWKRFAVFLKMFGGFLIPFNTILIFILIWHFLKHTDSIYTHLWSFFSPNLMSVCAYLLLESKRKYYTIYQKTLDPSTFNIMLYVIIILITLINNTRIDVQNVKEKKRFAKTSFVIDSIVINSDSLHYYIGNTKNYLFFYDQQYNRTTVFPMNKVNSISFGE